jgi:hypothetical protein
MRSKSLRGGLLATLTVSALVLLTASAAVATTGGHAAALPPNGVYTCSWIAAHPAAAAQARVSCDPSGGAAPSLGALPASSADATTPNVIEANGCQYVPSSTGRIGQGVWGWTSYEYAGSWGWTGFYSPAYYTWYLQKTDGTNYAHGEILDAGYHSVGIASNVYRWGAQNHSSTAQQWYVCYTG